MHPPIDIDDMSFLNFKMPRYRKSDELGVESERKRRKREKW